MLYSTEVIILMSFCLGTFSTHCFNWRFSNDRKWRRRKEKLLANKGNVEEKKQMRINDSKMFSFRIKEFTVLKREESDTDAQWKTFRTSREKKKCSQRSMYLCWKRYYFAFHWHLRRLNQKECCRMNGIPKSNKRPRWNKFTNKKTQANKIIFNQRIFSSIMALAIWKF